MAKISKKRRAAKNTTKPTNTRREADGPKTTKASQLPRENSKTANLVELLSKKQGASLARLQRAGRWQAHSVRGFLSGTVGKKLGLTVISTKVEDGERTYSVKA